MQISNINSNTNLQGMTFAKRLYITIKYIENIKDK